MTPLIEAFVLAREQGDQSGHGASLTPDALKILRTFANESPVMAVRRNAPALIETGLRALTILAVVDDPRDLTFSVAKLYHSATKLGIDTESLFTQVAQLASGNRSAAYLRMQMYGFPSRSVEDRRLSAFRLREVLTDEGFGFEDLPFENAPRSARSPNAISVWFRRVVMSMKRN